MSDVDRLFAYRDQAYAPGDPVRPVELVKEGPARSQKVKVRRLDGEYEGLEQWVPRIQLVALWEKVAALLEDERRMFAALEASGDVYGSVCYRAVETVFFALPQEPDEEIFFSHKAIEQELLAIENPDAAATRLGLPVEALLAEPYYYYT